MVHVLEKLKKYPSRMLCGYIAWDCGWVTGAKILAYNMFLLAMDENAR